jgi:hypothetical protein
VTVGLYPTDSAKQGVQIPDCPTRRRSGRAINVRPVFSTCFISHHLPDWASCPVVLPSRSREEASVAVSRPKPSTLRCGAPCLPPVRNGRQRIRAGGLIGVHRGIFEAVSRASRSVRAVVLDRRRVETVRGCMGASSVLPIFSAHETRRPQTRELSPYAPHALHALLVIGLGGPQRIPRAGYSPPHPTTISLTTPCSARSPYTTTTTHPSSWRAKQWPSQVPPDCLSSAMYRISIPRTLFSRYAT